MKNLRPTNYTNKATIGHFLWHRNTFRALLQGLEALLIDLEFPEVRPPLTQKIAVGIGRIRDPYPVAQLNYSVGPSIGKTELWDILTLSEVDGLFP